MFQLDLQSRLPIYEQLKNKIGELVMLGQLSPDDQLPSVRSVARDLGINPNTVQKAYQELERNGIIYSVVGRGSYVSPQAGLLPQLEEEYLRKIMTEVRRAKACGLREERVIQAVRQVFSEDDKL